MPIPKVERDPEIGDPPLLAALRLHWTSKCAGGRLPSRHAIVPTDIKAQLPHVLLVDVIDSGKDFRYRLVGTRLHDSFRGVPTGRLMSDVLAPFGNETMKQTLVAYRQVVVSRQPLRLRGDGSVYAQHSKFFDAILMPLADDGETVNMIFGGFFFDWDREKEYAGVNMDDWSAVFARA